VGGNPNNPAALEVRSKISRLDRLKRRDDDVVLFERPDRFARTESTKPFDSEEIT
jgi:hypothetical protein